MKLYRNLKFYYNTGSYENPVWKEIPLNSIHLVTRHLRRNGEPLYQCLDKPVRPAPKLGPIRTTASNIWKKYRP